MLDSVSQHMIFRAPEPDVADPRGGADAVPARACQRPRRQARVHRRTQRPHAHLSRMGGGPCGGSPTGLAARGFRKGDVFAIYSPNVPEYAVAFHAVSLLGGINTTINPLYTVTELSAPAQGLRRALPCDGAARAREGGAGGQRVAACARCSCSARPGRARPSPRCSQRRSAPPAVHIDPREDLVVTPYSSGTTGLPKGVMLTHYNLVANILQSAGALPPPRRRHHAGGPSLLPHLRHDRHHEPRPARRAPRSSPCRASISSSVCRSLQKHRVTFANVVPSDRPGARETSARGQVRPVAPADGRSQAPHRCGEDLAQAARAATGLPGRPGLWPHRNLSRHACHARGRRSDQHGEHRPAGAEHRGESRRRRDRRGAWAERGRRDLRARAPGDEGLLEPARRHRAP